MQNKTQELVGRMMEIVLTQPERIEALQLKMQEIGGRAQGPGNDLKARRKALGQMLAELAK
ncbi:MULTISPECIES: hypothetical protein [Tabrizicola]|uniref:hypothetical protein n=1 Tax=Tabrizicola TaxID=1443919 RepID=UPI0010815120|nr:MULTISPECIES: hypothetical protein [Paracoccaceae]